MKRIIRSSFAALALVGAAVLFLRWEDRFLPELRASWTHSPWTTKEVVLRDLTRGGVPEDASGVVLNLTATDPDGNQWEVFFVMEADGSGQTDLSKNTVQDFFPAWSPDGLYVYASAHIDGVPMIVRMPVDGGPVTRVPGTEGGIEPAAVGQEPCPAGAEPAAGRLGELLLEAVEAAEGAVDRRGQIAARRTAPVRAHDLPEQAVVGVTAAVVAHRGTDRLRHLLDPAQEVLDALGGEVRMSLEGVVQLRDVRLVVPVVVDLHRPGVDVGFQGVGGVRQRGQREGHFGISC